MPETRLPNFLIIGAMKAGTTSIYRDLLNHPQVFFPIDKEPGNLNDDRVLTKAGSDDYAAMFARSIPTQICGEASTTYTKLPEIAGVPQRARRLLGKDLRVIYLVREPLARTISQHYHEFCIQWVPRNINQAVRQFPRLIQFSRYAMQIKPWIEALGREQVHVVRFEDYVADRPSYIAQLCQFLGIDPRPDLVEPEAVYNKSEGKPHDAGLAAWLRKRSIYRSLIRPWLPIGTKDRLRTWLMPQSPARPEPPSAATVDYILDQVWDDAVELARILAVDEPLWDLNGVRRSYQEVTR